MTAEFYLQGSSDWQECKSDEDADVDAGPSDPVPETTHQWSLVCLGTHWTSGALKLHPIDGHLPQVPFTSQFYNKRLLNLVLKVELNQICSHLKLTHAF